MADEVSIGHPIATTKELDTRVCGTCREYKGIMTVEAFEDYLKTTFDCDCLSDLDDKVSA